MTLESLQLWCYSVLASAAVNAVMEALNRKRIAGYYREPNNTLRSLLWFSFVMILLLPMVVLDGVLMTYNVQGWQTHEHNAVEFTSEIYLVTIAATASTAFLLGTVRLMHIRSRV